MSEILNKKVSELSVLEMLEVSRLNWIAENPTIDISTFCRITGRTRKRINALLNNRLLPEELLVYGYEGRRQRMSVMFFTKEVIDWLKGQRSEVKAKELMFRKVEGGMQSLFD